MATVTIDSTQWLVTMATSLEEVTTGLAGVVSIPPGTGMLFDLGSDQGVGDEAVSEPDGGNIEAGVVVGPARQHQHL